MVEHDLCLFQPKIVECDSDDACIGGVRSGHTCWADLPGEDASLADLKSMQTARRASYLLAGCNELVGAGDATMAKSQTLHSV